MEITTQINSTETENYAIEQQRRNAMWQQVYGQQEQVLLSKIEELLLTNEKQMLLELFSNKNVIDPFRSKSNPMIEMIAVMDIYQLEANAGEKHTILDMKNEGKSLGRVELMKRIRDLRFLFWRFEFAKEADAGVKLLTFIKENQVSPYFLCKAVDTMAGNKLDMLGELVELTLDAGMIRHTYWLLRAMEQLVPGEESILSLLTELEKVCK